MSNRPLPNSNSSNRGNPRGRTTPAPANPYQRARRKRTVMRQVRQFESVLARLPLHKLNVGARLQSITVPAAVQGTPFHFSKLLSCLLLAAALSGLTLLHTQDDWFVYAEDIRFTNLIRLRADDLYAAADVEGWNVFWVQPEEIRARLLAQGWVADAQVAVTLPAAVDIQIQEMEPVAVWVTNAQSYWLASNGAAMPISDASVAAADSALPATALPQIIDSQQEARAVGTDETIRMDAQILNSALTLMAALPELENNMRYNRTVGLNFPLPDPAVWVYWGDGLDMEAKLENLAATRQTVRTRETPPQILDIRFVNRPYVR